MKIAYSNLACPEWTMPQVMENAARYGYEGVELRLLDGNVIPSSLDASQQRTLRKLACDNGIDIIGLGASTRFAMADDAERKAQVEELIRYIELASSMEVPFVRTFGGVGASSSDKDALQASATRVAQALNLVAPRARELGVEVLLETHDEFSSSTMVQAALRMVEDSCIGALWDVHHPVRMGETAAETYANLQARLRHVHIKDARRNGDGWDLVLLGDGEVPVQEIVRLLASKDYDGYLSVEWERKWHPEIQPADMALPQHITVLKGYLENAQA